LDWINQNPIRTVNLIYEKGQADGTSDIVLDVKEQPAMTLYGGFANTGLELTGENEVSAGFNISNPFATEQSLGYNFNSTIDFDSLTSHTLFYQAFLPWRHTLRLSGAYVLSHAETAQGFLPLNLDGENLQVSADYEVWLPRAQTGWFSRLRHSFFLGIDYKSTNTNFLFGGTEVFDTTGVVFQSRLGYDALLRDDLGFTRLNLGLTYSPGGVFSGNDDASFQALRRGSSADYWYGFAELERGFRLPGDWSFVLRSSGQWTSSRLISTEQILAGGYRTARGYDENLIRGDSGVIASAELMAPKFSILSNERDQWNLFGFYDAAFLQVTHRGEGEPNPNLQSAGLGLNVKLGQTAFARLAYGWVVSFDGVDQALVGSGKLHFGITLRF
ncbi:MAG: ShlB/FhaC/HecB family hemolysin secretion/activation protein, partial [Verrucomicrobiales bacterium]|nr:ShlB/FhaC/HecB family hemolysin secretion/activation protein [Verrucomicrobiales bacterium]